MARLEDVVVPIIGTTSLLTNRISEFALENIRRGEDGETKLKDLRTEDERWEDARYLADDNIDTAEDGRYGVPANAFRNAMVAVCRNKKASGGVTMSAALQMFQVLGDVLPVRCRIFKKRVDAGRNAATKGLVRVVRPEFIDWESDVPIRYNSDIISASQILNLIEQAGFSLGVGAWRPEKRGNHGMFQVKAGALTTIKSK